MIHTFASPKRSYLTPGRLLPWAGILLIFLLSSCGLFQNKGSAVFPSQRPEGIPVDSTGYQENSDSDKTDLRPFLKESGEKFKIAVIDSDGLWPPYVKVFAGIIEGLQTIGWINETTELADPAEVSIKEYLEFLNEQDYSDYLDIGLDTYIDLEWNEEKVKDPLFQKIFSQDSPVDLAVCMGTLGGKVIAEMDPIPIPVIADSISDPISSGIIISNTDSGKENLTVRVDPYRYNRQIRLFFDIVHFKRLGMIYEDTQDGRAYAALDDVTKVSREYGFEIISNTNVLGDSAESDEEAEAAYIEAVRELAPKIDAIYLTEQKGLSANNISEVMTILEEYEVPSFSMTGAKMVARGVLFGVSDSERISTGVYHAKNIVSILQGTPPREINQIFEHLPQIAVNLDAASAIGYDIPIDIIASSDEIYKNKVEH